MDLVWERIRPFPPLSAITESLRDSPKTSQAWDEARHIGIVASAVRELVREWGLYPFNCTIWKVHVDRPDPLERLALGNKNLKASPALNYGIG